MIEAHDYSTRRGVLVPLLPKIHALLTETANKDTLAGIEPPVNIILWKQEMSKKLVDANRRWMIAMDGNALAGVFLFHFKETYIYLDELRIAWAYRKNNSVYELFHYRFINDPVVKNAAAVFAGKNIKKETNQEILASVGFEAHFEDGLEPLGKPADAAGTLKLRYTR